MFRRTPARPVAIIGAGIAGLTAAHYLRRNGVPVVLFEAGKQIAGMAASYADNDGFSYDFGAHFITNRLAAAIGVGALCRDVKYYGESVALGGKVYGYPFGLLANPRYLAGGITGKLRSPLRSGECSTAADWFRAEFGRPLADEVALPLLEAWSGAPADQLSAAVGGKLGNSIPYTLYLKYSARLKKRAVSIGYSNEMPENPNVWHVYPEGGVAALCHRLASDLQDAIAMESPVEKILVDSGAVRAVRVNGVEREVSAAISTAPCPILAKLVEGSDAVRPMSRFRYRPMIFVNLRFDARGVLPDTVLWTPGKQYPFFRLTETPLSMPWLAPAGKTIITADIGAEIGDAMWKRSDEELGQLCLESIVEFYPQLRGKYLGCRVLKTPIAYPVYLNEYETERRRFEQGTGIGGLYSIGRNGEFAHILMEDIYWRTLRKMNDLLSGAEPALD